MASFNLTRVDLFPEGTSIGAYPASAWHPTVSPSGAPIGSATASATMTSGVAAFTGLADDTRYYFAASVGGTYRYIGGKTPVAVASTTPVPTGSEPVKAADYGLLGMSFPPEICVGNVDVAAGFLIFVKIFLRSGVAPSNIHCHVVTAGSSLVSGQCFGFVFGSDGTLLAKTATLHTALQSTGAKTAALVAESGQVLPAGGDGVWVHAGFVVNGTPPNLANVGGSPVSNFGLATAASRVARSSGNSNTSVPATMPAITVDSSRSIWVALS